MWLNRITAVEVYAVQYLLAMPLLAVVHLFYYNVSIFSVHKTFDYNPRTHIRVRLSFLLNK